VVKRVVFAVPGDLDTPTGGYAYDKRIIEELRKLGWDVSVSDLGNSFPRPDVKARQIANAMLAKLDPAIPVVIDGLAFGVLPEAGAALRKSHALIALVHHPLAFESGLPADDVKEFHRSERDALRHVRHVIVTSPATARLLASDYDIAMDRITVARPGNDPASPSRGSGTGPLHLLAVGSIVPRKGYDVLVTALSELKDLSWRLSIVGDPTRDPDCSNALDRDIDRFDLRSRIERLGAVSQQTLAPLYGRTDLFVLPSRFEGYGMAFADAIAFGVPVVAARAGAIPETLPPQASILVPPDDAAALAFVLRRLIENAGELEALRAQARSAAKALPSWRESAEIVARAIGMVV
jgi:glycosyltransferase involved in cell wall biosynthesis